MPATVRTRFAPSPTGYLHIGGARTALFNYLLAKRLGGKFVLRIEDTDQKRNIAGAEQKLLDDMRWLGLQWDEGPEVGGEFGPYAQRQRLERYRACADRLIADGKAYYAFETRDELDEMRRAAEREKGGFLYPRPDPLPTPAEADKARDEGRPVVLRFLHPGCDVTVTDEILGEVTVAASAMDDFVIMKADGWPTYHFAVVVDDEEMRITHVLRGQEHLINTPKHILLQQALGFSTPRFAHLPIILGSGGSKMSKREKDKVVRDAVRAALDASRFTEDELIAATGCGDAEAFKRWRKKKMPLDAVGLERTANLLGVVLPEIDIHDFRRSGYLPEVILNFIALLGWSPGDDREKMTLDEMGAAFGVERIGKTNANFDRDKLLSFNTDAANEAGADRMLAALRDFLAANPDSPLTGCDDATLSKLIEINKGYRTFRDIEAKTAAIFAPNDAFDYDDKAFGKVLLKNDGEGLGVLRELRTRLEGAADWTPESLDALVREFGEQKQLGLGKVAQPLRVAIMGNTISPPIFDTLVLVGRDDTLTRIDRALAYASATA